MFRGMMPGTPPFDRTTGFRLGVASELDAENRSQLASFLVDSGICSPEDLASSDEGGSAEALLDGLVERGRLSQDQGAVLKQVALGPWFDPDNPVRTPSGTVPAAGPPDYHTVWAGAPLLSHEQRYAERTQHAKGGMGRVIRAFDTAMQREVAIKELLPEIYNLAGGDMSTLPRGIGANQDAIQRFLNEARITGQLEHPAIVPVYEIGTQTDGTPYYTMKLVRGKSLADAIREAKTLEDRVKLLPHFVDLCQAIAFAHSRGVIHRDIKPSNVLLGEYGETLVIDWGLAKMRSPGHGAGNPATMDPASGVSDSGRTMMGQVLGTPIYMAPEQARGALNEIDERSDVYSLGVVLYEILVGEAPFTHSKPDILLALKQQEAPPPVRTREKLAPPDLAAICERALDREPDGRYQSAVELAEDVERFMSGSLVEAYQYTVGQQLLRFARRHKLPLAVAAVAFWIVAVIGAVSYLSVLDERDTAVAATMREADARGEAEAALRTVETARAEVVASEERVRRELYLSTVGLVNTLVQSGEFIRARGLLADTEPDLRGWEWSWLLMQANADEQSWPVQPQHWQQVDIPPRVDWEHQRIMLHGFESRVRISILHDLRHRVEVTGMRESTFVPMQGAFLLPDGERILNFSQREVRLTSVARLQYEPEHEVPIYIPLSWAPQLARDGRTALFATDYRAAAVFDTHDLAMLREFHSESGISNALLLAESGRVLIAQQPPFVSISDEAGYTLWDIESGSELATFSGFRSHPAAAAPDNHSVVLTRLDGTPVLLDLDASAARFTLTAGLAGQAMQVAFAENAPFVAVSCDAGSAAVYDVETGGLIQSCELPETPSALALSPDGRKLAAGGAAGTVFVMEGDTVRSYDGHEGHIRDVSFSPGGERLAAVDDHGLRIWNLDAPGPTVGLDAPLVAAAFTRDDRAVAGFSAEAGGGLWRTCDGGRASLLFEDEAVETTGVMGPNGEYVLLRDAHAARLVRMEDGATLARVEGADFLRAPAAFTRDGSMAALVMSDVYDRTERSYLVLIEIAAGGAVARFPLLHIPPQGDPYFSALAFSPDNDRIYLTHTDVMTEYDLESGEPLRVRNVAPAHTGHGNVSALSPDGSVLVVSGDRGAIIVTEIDGDSFSLPAHSAQITAMAFTPDGGRLLTGSADGTLKLWDMATWREVLPLPALDGTVTGVAFNLRCGTLLTVEESGAARLHHVLAFGVDLDGALPGIDAAERWSLYRRLHPALASPEGRCDAAAQERLLTALGYTRGEALGILAPLYPEPIDAECADDHIPSNRLFLHTLGALAERETNPERREALAHLAYEALQRSTPFSHDVQVASELAAVANELIQSDSPKAQAALAFARESEVRLREYTPRDARSVYGTIARAYVAAGDWEAAWHALSEIHESGTGVRDLLWASVNAQMDSEEAHLESAATLANYLARYDAGEEVEAIQARLAASPHASVRERAAELLPYIAPDPSAVRSLPWRTDLDTALAEATEREGIVLVYVESTRSQANMLEAERVLSRPDALEWARQHAVPVRVDAQESPGLVRQLGVTRLPAVVVLNRLGDPIWSYEPPMEYRHLLRQLHNEYTRPGAIRAMDVAGPLPFVVEDAGMAQELAGAVAHPADFAHDGEIFPWMSSPTTTISNNIVLRYYFDETEQTTFIAVAAVETDTETPVTLRGQGSGHTFVFINGELVFEGEGRSIEHYEAIHVTATLPAGRSHIVTVLGSPDYNTALRLRLQAREGAPAPRVLPPLNEHVPVRRTSVEMLDTVAMPAETPVVRLHKDYLLREWREINAEFMRTAEISFVEVDDGRVGVRIGNASDFALTRQLGLRDGDIIVSLNGLLFNDSTGIIATLEELDGQIIPEWHAGVIRGGSEMLITVLVDYD